MVLPYQRTKTAFLFLKSVFIFFRNPLTFCLNSVSQFWLSFSPALYFFVAAVTDYLFKCIFKLVVVHIREGYGFPFTFEVISAYRKVAIITQKTYFLNHLRVESLTYCLFHQLSKASDCNFYKQGNTYVTAIQPSHPGS